MVVKFIIEISDYVTITTNLPIKFFRVFRFKRLTETPPQAVNLLGKKGDGSQGKHKAPKGAVPTFVNFICLL